MNFTSHIAHVKTGNMSNLYYSWVTVIVRNEYGTAEETMKFAPVSGETDPDETLIQDIIYDYQLFYDYNWSEFDCVGTLSLSIALPENTIRLFFEHTRSHMTYSDLNDVIFKGKAYYSPTSNITKPDMYWGTYFRVYAVLSNGDIVYSPKYSINDYIDPQDLDLLLSSVDNTEIDEVDLHVENKNLYVNAHETLSLSVLDLSGKLLFIGEIQQTAVIPLDNTSSSVVIVTYKTSSATKTIKMLVK